MFSEHAEPNNAQNVSTVDRNMCASSAHSISYIVIAAASYIIGHVRGAQVKFCVRCSVPRSCLNDDRNTHFCVATYHNEFALLLSAEMMDGFGQEIDGYEWLPDNGTCVFVYRKITLEIFVFRSK